MGGDHAPDEIVAGALAAQREHGIRILLTGPAARLRQALAAAGADPGSDGIDIVPAEDNLAMDEGALASLRRPRSSVAVACQLVRRGEAAAVVSAGSTGGVVATARLRLRSLPGVDRPGLAVVLPTRPGRTVLIDAGATADPKPEMLVQFGQLGVAYAQLALGVPAPRVGLLTIGTEPGKGNKFTRRAHELLAADPPHGALPLTFAGNVEGGDLLAGEVDVIVTDGFTGNVALKTLEGSIRFASAELRAAVTGTPDRPARAPSCSAAGCASSPRGWTRRATAAPSCSAWAGPWSSPTARAPPARSPRPACSPPTWPAARSPRRSPSGSAPAAVPAAAAISSAAPDQVRLTRSGGAGPAAQVRRPRSGGPGPAPPAIAFCAGPLPRYP